MINMPSRGRPGIEAVAGRLHGRLLGIDAGGSASRAVVLEAGAVTGLPPGPPMNALLTADLVDRIAAIVGPASPDAVGIGMPGLRGAGQARELSGELARRTGCPVHVTDDARTAWLGAFCGEPGIVVIAGTGSAAVGTDGRRWVRAGGHGFILGDEGSAYWIGRAGAQAALHWQDGVGGSEAIFKAVIEASGLDLDALVADVQSHVAERDRLALLAPVISGLAEEDEAAARIAREAAGHLARLAGVLQRKIGPLPVAAAGGVLESPAIWAPFAEISGAGRPAEPAAVGAAIFAGAPELVGELGYG